MAITKEKKKGIIENVKNILKDSSSLVFINFKGLNVQDTTEIRRTLREKGVGYYVAKKTLAGIALDEKNFDGSKPELPGEVALVYGQDNLAPAREIYTFQKKFKEKISIIGGIFDGTYQSKDEMITIAQIPPIEVLRGQFVNIINSPIQRFAVVLNEVAKTK